MTVKMFFSRIFESKFMNLTKRLCKASCAHIECLYSIRKASERRLWPLFGPEPLADSSIRIPTNARNYVVVIGLAFSLSSDIMKAQLS